MPDDKSVVVAIDQGTTSTRCMLVGRTGNVVAVDQKEHEQIYPRPGWVEHSPDELWQRTQEVVQGALVKSGLQTRHIASIGITTLAASVRAPGASLPSACSVYMPIVPSSALDT